MTNRPHPSYKSTPDCWQWHHRSHLPALSDYDHFPLRKLSADLFLQHDYTEEQPQGCSACYVACTLIRSAQTKYCFANRPPGDFPARCFPNKPLQTSVPKKHKRKPVPCFLSLVRRPDTVKQKNAFPPNFIHSLDSTHMMLTALQCYRYHLTARPCTQTERYSYFSCRAEDMCRTICHVIEQKQALNDGPLGF